MTYNRTKPAFAVGSEVLGQIALHDLTYSPAGLWQLQGNYSDISGNNLTLTPDPTQGGLWTTLAPGIQAAAMVGTGLMAYRESNDAVLEITGAVTVEFLAHIPGKQTYLIIPVYFSGPTDSEEDNDLYAFRWEPGFSGHLGYFCEHGSGINYSFSDATYKIPIGRVFHCAMTRDSAGTTVKMYIDGNLVANSDGASTKPTGGTAGFLKLMYSANVSTGNPAIASVKIIASELSGSQILAEAKRCLGYL